jgi:putative aldouronate transport system permease protein
MHAYYKKTFEDYAIDGVVMLMMIIVFLATVYPFWYALVISFNNGLDASRGGVYFWPRVWTLENYRAVFSMDQIFSGAVVSVARTIFGTLTALIFTSMFAYAIAHTDLMFRRVYMVIILISMYFSGGLIPFFILLKNLGLMNNFLVYIILGLLGIWNAIIMMSFFREISPSLEEAARIDGANDLYIFFRIIVPISTPVFATIALFIGVSHWNSWFDAAYYVTDRELKTLAFWLVEIIKQASIHSMSATSGVDLTREAMGAAKTFTPDTVRMSTMIVVVVPIVCVYPFLQRYFVKGIMIGSLKE